MVQETIQDPLKNKNHLKKIKNPLKKIPQNLLIKDFKELFSRHYFVTNTILFVFRLPF